MFALIPFTALPLVLYVIAAMFFTQVDVLSAPGQVSSDPFWDRTLIAVHLVSGKDWALNYGDAIVTLALGFLLLALLRTASKRSMSVLGNMVMVLILCVYLIMFLVADFAGTSTFFLLTVIALVDTLATVSISMVASHSSVEVVPE